MAKVDLAPLATVGRGKLGTVVFSGQGGVDFVRRDVNPNQPDSGGQQNVRAIVRNASHVWGRFPYAQPSLGFTSANPFQPAWDFIVKKRKTTAYAAFVESFYKDALINGRAERIRLVNSTAGNHPPVSVEIRAGSNPNSWIVTVRTPDYYPSRFPHASVYVFVLPYYNPLVRGRLSDFFITYREFASADADSSIPLQMDQLPGVPFPASNFIYGAGMIYRVEQGGRILGYSDTVQRYRA